MREAGELASMDGFKNFVVDMGLRPKGFWLDRIDNDGDYTHENCRWATAKKQNNNKCSNVIISAIGRTMTKSEWCDMLNVTAGQLDRGSKVLGSYADAVTAASKIEKSARKSIRWIKYLHIS